MQCVEMWQRETAGSSVEQANTVQAITATGAMPMMRCVLHAQETGRAHNADLEMSPYLVNANHAMTHRTVKMDYHAKSFQTARLALKDKVLLHAHNAQKETSLLMEIAQFAMGRRTAKMV